MSESVDDRFGPLEVGKRDYQKPNSGYGMYAPGSNVRKYNLEEKPGGGFWAIDNQTRERAYQVDYVKGKTQYSLPNGKKLAPPKPVQSRKPEGTARRLYNSAGTRRVAAPVQRAKSVAQRLFGKGPSGKK